MSSLKNLAVRGAVWTFIGYGMSQSLRLGSNLILTRLLAPELFGLMALGNIFITGLTLFSDVGIGPSIIQNKRGDDQEFLNTAWTIQVIRGVGLWLCCLIIAWPVSNFYEDQRLVWLVPALGFSTVFSGFNSTAIFTLNRKIALGKLTIFDTVVQVISLAVMVVWAWLSPTIWALVAGNLVAAFLKMAWSHQLIPGSPNRFAWNQVALKEIASFGRWVFVSTAMAFLSTQTDRLILGKLLSFEILGIYSIAFMFAELPKQVIKMVGIKVIFPVVSRRSESSRQSLRNNILRKRGLLLLALVPLISVLVCFGDFLILWLYDDRYSQATWMLPILALGIWLIVLAEPSARCLNAIGKPQYLAFGNLFRFIFIVVFLPISFNYLGILGAVLVVSLNDLPAYVAISYGLWQEKLLMLAQDIQVTSLFIGLTALLLGSRLLLGLGLPIAEIL